jgi:hypothetical protein
MDEITVSMAHLRYVFTTWLDDVVPDPSRTPEQVEIIWQAFLSRVVSPD